MIDFLNGFIASKEENTIVLDVSGVGFALLVSTNTMAEVGEVGEEARLMCRLLHREDSMELVGFATQDERKLFDAMVSISGIGPKMAVNILSGMDLAELVSAISNKNLKTLAGIKGLGQKRAEKICFELESAVKTINLSFASSNIITDATDALVALGFARNEALLCVKEASKIVGESSIDALLKMALELGKR